jgi:hypothetical protein
MFTPLYTHRGEHSQLFRRMEGRTDNFTLRGQLHPSGTKFTPEGQLRPWAWKFAPMGKVKVGPLDRLIYRFIFSAIFAEPPLLPNATNSYLLFWHCFCWAESSTYDRTLSPPGQQKPVVTYLKFSATRCADPVLRFLIYNYKDHSFSKFVEENIWFFFQSALGNVGTCGIENVYNADDVTRDRKIGSRTQSYKTLFCQFYTYL